MNVFSFQFNMKLNIMKSKKSVWGACNQSCETKLQKIGLGKIRKADLFVTVR